MSLVVVFGRGQDVCPRGGSRCRIACTTMQPSRNVKTGMPPFGILANHKIKMCHNSMKKIMTQKITQNNWNF